MSIWKNLQEDVYNVLNDSGDLEVFDYIPGNEQYQFLLIDSWVIDPRRNADKTSRKLGDGSHITLTLTAYSGGEDKGYAKAIDMIEDATCLIADNGSSIRGLTQLVTTSYTGSRAAVEGEPIWLASATIDFYLS